MADQVSIGVVCTIGIGPDRGGRQRNEDNYLVCHQGRIRYRKASSENVQGGETLGVLLAIADGMGGHRDGDLAATAAVQALARIFSRGQPRDPEESLREHVLTCHRRLRRKAAEQGPVQMGTTLTAAWILGGQLAWTQVGDSRLYLERSEEFRRLSRDQTRGEFARRDGRTLDHDQGFLAQNLIYGSRGIGDDEAIRLDPGVDSGCLSLSPGDRLVLCSDGLSGVVDDASMQVLLRDRPEPQDAAFALMEQAIESGSTDNISVLVARIESLDSPVDEASVDRGQDPDTLVPMD